MVAEFVPREQQEVAAELTQKFEFFDSARTPYQEPAIEDYKLYRTYMEDYQEEEKDESKRSRLHIPYTYEVLDTIRARIISSFFDSRPYVDFVPEPEGGEAHQLYVSEQKAEVASALVDMQLEKNNIYQTFYEYITSLLIFPASIMSVGWRYEEAPIQRKAKMPDIRQTSFGPQFAGWYDTIIESVETIWDDNEINLVDFFDFWPDPRGKDIDTCRGVFQREWMTQEELEQMVTFLYQLQEGVVYPIDLDSLRGQEGQGEDGVWQRQTAVGLSPESRDGFLTEGPDRSKNLFEILHYWEDNRHSILINGSEVIYDGPSPYWRHRKKPFVVESYEPLPGEFYGMSAVRLINHLQHELNTQRNQRIDNVSFVMNRMWKIRRGADIDESELISSPGGVLKVDNMDDVMPLETSDVTSSSYQEEATTKRDMENTVGATSVVRGAEGTRKETATAESIKATGAGIRFESKIRLFENTGIARLAELMDMNNQQFISEERLVKLGPEESVMWRMVEPDEIIGEFDYRPAGQTIDPATNREIRRAQLTEMIQFLLATQNPYIDFHEVTKAYVESFDLRNPQKFLVPQEIVQQQMMQQQAMMAQQAVNGGGAQEAGGQAPTMTVPGQQGTPPQPPEQQRVDMGVM